MFRVRQAGMAAFAIAIVVCGNLFGQQYSDVFKRSYAAAAGSEAIIGDYQPLDVTAADGVQLPESAAEGSSDQRLDELEKMVRELRDKANKKRCLP